MIEIRHLRAAIVTAETKTAGLRKNLLSLNNLFKAVLVLEDGSLHRGDPNAGGAGRKAIQQQLEQKRYNVIVIGKALCIASVITAFSPFAKQATSGAYSSLRRTDMR